MKTAGISSLGAQEEKPAWWEPKGNTIHGLREAWQIQG